MEMSESYICTDSSCQLADYQATYECQVNKNMLNLKLFNVIQISLFFIKFLLHHTKKLYLMEMNKELSS